AADWVIDQRKLTEVRDSDEKVLEYGLLPAGHLEDNRDWGHWFAVNAFAAAGMTQMAVALADAGLPEAERYTREAAAYVQDLRTAVIRASQRSPVVRLRGGAYVPWVPPVLISGSGCLVRCAWRITPATSKRPSPSSGSPSTAKCCMAP